MVDAECLPGPSPNSVECVGGESRLGFVHRCHQFGRRPCGRVRYVWAKSEALGECDCAGDVFSDSHDLGETLLTHSKAQHGAGM